MLNNLIEWEKGTGLKAQFIAEKLGLTAAQYSKIKHGLQKPTVNMADKLKTEFNVKDPIKLLINSKEGGE